MSHIVHLDPELQPLMPHFVENRQQELTEILQAFDQVEFSKLNKFGHAFRGVCLCYGFHEAAEFGWKLQKAAQAAQKENTKQILEGAFAYFQDVEIRYGKAP